MNNNRNTKQTRWRSLPKILELSHTRLKKNNLADITRRHLQLTRSDPSIIKQKQNNKRISQTVDIIKL